MGHSVAAGRSHPGAADPVPLAGMHLIEEIKYWKSRPGFLPAALAVR